MPKISIDHFLRFHINLRNRSSGTSRYIKLYIILPRPRHTPYKFISTYTHIWFFRLSHKWLKCFIIHHGLISAPSLSQLIYYSWEAPAAANKWCSKICALCFEEVFFSRIIGGVRETESNSSNNDNAHMRYARRIITMNFSKYLNKIFLQVYSIRCVHKISMRGKTEVNAYFQNNFRTRIMPNCIKMKRNFFGTKL